MNKHFLITATEQKSGNYGAKFFGHFFENKQDIKATLFYTAARPPVQWEKERTAESARDRQKIDRENKEKGQKALNAAKKILEDLGFAQEQVITKVQSRKLSRAEDIIHEGSEGNYDALVLGRRGLSWIEEAFDESVSKRILERKYDFPLWLCRMPDVERKNVLVCLDGSDPAYRIADHVGFALHDETKHRVQLLRVKNDRSEPGSDAIFKKAKEQLLKNTFPEHLIDIREIEGSDPAKVILEEAESGRYAAVAAGWTGAGKGALERIFYGSNCHKLLNELKHAALWTCY